MPAQQYVADKFFKHIVPESKFHCVYHSLRLEYNTSANDGNNRYTVETKLEKHKEIEIADYMWHTHIYIYINLYGMNMWLSFNVSIHVLFA